jgi:hypothetical protein
MAESHSKLETVQAQRRIIESIPLHDGPSSIPMSMPAILRQNVAGYKARTAVQRQKEPSAGVRDRRVGGKEERRFSKRKQRRWENGMCASV